LLGNLPFLKPEFKDFTNVNHIYVKDINGITYYMEYNMPQVKVNEKTYHPEYYLPYSDIEKELFRIINYDSLNALFVKDINYYYPMVNLNLIPNGENNPLFEPFNDNITSSTSFLAKYYISRIHLEFWKQTFDIDDINDFKEKYYYYYCYCVSVKYGFNKKAFNPNITDLEIERICKNGNPLFNLKIKKINKTLNDIIKESPENKNFLEKLLNPFELINKGVNIEIKWEKVDNIADTDTSDFWYLKDGKYIRMDSWDIQSHINKQRVISNIYKLLINITPEEIKDENLLIKMKYQE
jgi:hypothetical protein